MSNHPPCMKLYILTSGVAGNRTRVREASFFILVHVRSRLTQTIFASHTDDELRSFRGSRSAKPFCKVQIRWLGNTGRASPSWVDGVRIQEHLPNYQFRPPGPGRSRCRWLVYRLAWSQRIEGRSHADEDLTSTSKPVQPRRSSQRSTTEWSGKDVRVTGDVALIFCWITSRKRRATASYRCASPVRFSNALM